MNTQKEMAIIVTAFILILLGIIFAGVIADQVYDTRNTYTVDNENITVTSAQINKAFINATYDDWVRVINVSNASNKLMTVTTDYTVNLAYGGVNISTAGNNTDGRTYYYVSYEFYPDNYVKSTTSRSLLNLIIIFFVIGVLGIGVGAAWRSIREWAGGGGRL